MASILKVDTLQGGTSANITVDPNTNFLANGHIIQVKNTNANYNWGSWGSQAEMDMSWMDVTLTTNGNNSSFFIAAQFSVDDTNSSTFGVGLGVKYTINAGSSWTWIRYPALHEIYDSVGSDKYNISYMNITTGKLGISAGITTTFRCVSRFNNSNAQHFGGNGGTYYAQLHTVMEIGG